MRSNRKYDIFVDIYGNSNCTYEIKTTFKSFSIEIETRTHTEFIFFSRKKKRK
jgi:hypothetical protein